VVKTCAAYIADSGRTWTGQLGIASDEHLPGLRAELVAPTFIDYLAADWDNLVA
jgi:hypothetical protein